MPDTLEYSMHAQQRMAQRGIDWPAVEYVLEYGRRIYRAGMLHCFLGKKDIPATDRHNPNIRRWEGTTVLLNSKDGTTVVTVYRNKSALKQIRCKAKTDLSKRRKHNSIFQ